MNNSEPPLREEGQPAWNSLKNKAEAILPQDLPPRPTLKYWNRNTQRASVMAYIEALESMLDRQPATSFQFKRLRARAESAERDISEGYRWPTGELLSVPPNYCVRSFIAAASPDVILRLIAENESLKATNEKLLGLVREYRNHHEQDYGCDKCADLRTRAGLLLAGEGQ